MLLLDQLQNLPEEEQKPLCELIRRSPNRRFFLLSRGTPPGWLIHFQFSGLMLVLDARALLFDRDSTAKLLRLMGGDPTDLEVTAIQRESLGYPLAVAMIGREMANGSPYSPEIDAKVRRELYIHYETAVYRRFDLPIRRFLLEISPFTTFDIELARMVTGDSAVGEVIDWLQRNTSMLQYDGIQRFHFWDIFRNFLQWEMDREYTPEKQRAIFDRGGLYYELNGQSALALECYTKAGDHAKVSDLLTRNAECHPGTGHYEEMERYYRALPEEEILASPALMQAMCMLCALEMEYEESERWYQALADFAARCERTDAARKQARQPPGLAGHRSAPAGRDGPDRHHPQGVSAAEQAGDRPAALFRDQYAAEHSKRRQGFFRLEQEGRSALPDHSPPRRGCPGQGRGGPAGLRHSREQV